MRYRSLFTLVAVLLAAASARAQSAGIEFFERKIRPILVEHCYECHSAGAKKLKGKLLLDSRAGVQKGGISGPVVVPGHPEKSLLIMAVRFTDESTKMPPKGKLPAAMIADLEMWVKMGAPDPRDKATVVKAAKSWDEVVAERRKWWSLQPVKKPAVPTPKNEKWSKDPIDRFLLAAMEAKGLTSANDADPRTLIRRLSLVLTGLPPTTEEVEAFVKAANATPQAALEKLVDRLLASPHFGERWARHWMDVVRFTETHGNEWNYDVHHAWRYRDYLIRAFNDDVSFDQLVREHIAGDLLPRPRVRPPSPLRGREARGEGAGDFNESIIGTAFYRFGEVNHDDCIDLRSIGYDLVDNQIDTLSKAFQAMTIACARCHDHKIDAISMRDYHGLLGILRSSRQVAHTIDGPGVNADIMEKMQAMKRTIRKELGDAWLKALGPAEKGNVLALFEHNKAMEHPSAVMRLVADAERSDKLSFAEAWKKIANQYVQEDNERTKIYDQNFTILGGFPSPRDWQFGGQGLRGGPAKSGEFALASDGARAVSAILPAGVYTHTLSEKLNGTLRSPNLTSKHKFISFHVLGDRAAAVRLVSNNCQLNYRNYKYLTKNELHWVTIPIPDDAESLRTYAELVTKFDNPKFPDQLGTLGGDKLNYRIPWEQAAADPRSHFGVTKVVLHDRPDPPKASLSHLRFLFQAPAPESHEQLAKRVSTRFEDAVKKWRDDQASDDDVRWLETLLQSRFTGNRANLSPKLELLIAEYRRLETELAVPRVVPGLSDSADPDERFEQPIFARGDCMRPGEKTPRRYVEVLAPRPMARTGSGRLELANAITSPDNPLTARVMVNRVWHHLFGTGIVRTVDDFGHVGELPSHPELLDYLADRFMYGEPGASVPGGWSVKKLIRAIVLTRAFRLSHTPSAAMLETDPENRLLAHYPARRMEAEAIRDSLLATSGRLDRTLYGLSIPAYREKEYADRRLFKGPLDGNGRRSIYIKVTLMEPPKFLEVFNLPGSKVCQGRRDVVNTPAQALAMLNDPFVHQQADVWAKRLIQGKQDTVQKRIDTMFRTAVGRDPRKEERERFTRFVTQVSELHGVPAEGVLWNPLVWRDVGHAMFNLSEFITIP